jgi:DNA-binding transcriptional ArsR family regulator
MTDFCNEIEALGKGIGNAQRYKILEALMKGSKTVGEITKAVKAPQPSISQGLKVLKTANLVSDERRGQEVYYSINVSYMASILKTLTKDIQKSRKR